MLFKQHIIRTGFQRQENSVFLNYQKEATISTAAENVPTHFDWDDCGITIFGNFPPVTCYESNYLTLSIKKEIVC